MNDKPHLELLIDTLEEMYRDNWGREESTLVYLGPDIFREIESECDHKVQVSRSSRVPSPRQPAPVKFTEDPEELGTPSYEAPGQLSVYGRILLEDPTIEDRRAVVFDTSAIQQLSTSGKRHLPPSEGPGYALKSASAIRELQFASESLGRETSPCSYCGGDVEGEVWLEGTGGELYCDINCMNGAIDT